MHGGINMKKKIILGIILASVIPIIVACLIINEILSFGTVESRSIILAAAFIAGDISFCIRYFSPIMKRGSVQRKYDEVYRDVISDAFTGEDRKKERADLIKAISLYNANKFNASISLLNSLLPKCTSDREKYAVLLFTALSLTDSSAYEAAIDIYLEILKFNTSSSTVYSNLGLLYTNLGDLKNALDAYKKAVECDPDNPYAYNNIATIFIRNAEYEKAIPFAIKAYEIKSNLTPATNSLAICYSVLGEKDLANKYFKISVSNGVNAEGLSRTIKNIAESEIDL